jgi:hypothetical protein
MQIGKAFSFPFQDKSWISKFLLAAVISIVPILSFAWVGYIVELVKNVIDHKEEPLPEWGDFGKKFVDGFIVTVAYFVYSLPALLVVCLMSGLFFIPAVVQSSGNASQDTVSSLFAGSSFVAFCLICLVAIYALVLTVLLPAILANFAQKRTFQSCFQLGDVYRMAMAHGSTYFMVVLMIIVVGFGVGLVVGLVTGVIGLIPCIGWIASLILSMLSVAYIGAVTGHLVGQYGAETYNPPSDMISDSDMTMAR